MKTVKGWFESVEDKGVRDFLLERMTNPGNEAENLIVAIWVGFAWHNTSEGIGLWNACFDSFDPIAYLRNYLDSLKPPKRIQQSGRWYVLEEEEEIEVMEIDEYVYASAENEFKAWKFKGNTKIDGFELNLLDGTFKGDNDIFLIGLLDNEKESWDVFKDEGIRVIKDEKHEIMKFCQWLKNRDLI